MAIIKPEYTKIVLSGVEGDRFFETARDFANCRSMLMSFLYAGTKGNNWFENRAKKNPDVKWMIDSGAHSFRSEGYCEKWPDLAWFEDYVRRYRDWVIQHKDIIDLCVNLDTDNVCGFDKMVEWDNDIFRPMERAGVSVCYVWHQAYGFDYWLKMCREHEYVGLPGNLEEAEWHKMIRPAMMNGCRVHGFAATKGFILGKVPLATSDSTSWKAGERYGQTFVFENGGLHVFDKNQKDQRKRYKARWVSLGVDWPALEQDKAEEITKVCAVAWADYQEHTKNLSSKLAYWLKTSKPFDELGDLKKVGQAEVGEVFKKAGFNYPLTSDAQASDIAQTFRAFLARDSSVVFALSDEYVDKLVSDLHVQPENSSRAEREAAIRQHLYSFFYKLNAAEPQPRMKIEDVTSTKDYLARYEELRDAPSVAVDLEDAPTTAALEDQTVKPTVFIAVQGQNSSAPNTPGSSENDGAEAHSAAQGIGLQESVSKSEVQPNTAFTESISDRVVRMKARLGVELLFEQFKLRAQAESMKARGKGHRLQKSLFQRASALTPEITLLSDAVGEEVAAAMRAAAQEALEVWKAAVDESDTPPVEPGKLALRPQNQLTPERARAIGRLGGAPPGNQNRRKHGLYSSKLPNLACDNCPHIQVCPKYRAGHVCAYLNEFNTWSPEQQNSEIAVLENILAEQVKRATRGLMFETFEGGIVNKEVGKVLKQTADLAVMLRRLKEPPPPPKTAFGAPVAPSTPGKPSIMESLFGDLKKPVEAQFTVEKNQEKPDAAPPSSGQ